MFLIKVDKIGKIIIELPIRKISFTKMPINETIIYHGNCKWSFSFYF